MRSLSGEEGDHYREGDRVYSQPGEALDPPKPPSVPDTERVEVEPVKAEDVAQEGAEA